MKPTATNNLNPLGVFRQRKLYKEKFFPFNRTAQPFDLWEQRGLHGKINRKNQPVVLKQEKLVLVSSQNGVYIPDFFAQAFREFRSDIQRKKAKGQIDLSNSFLKDLEPKKGWNNIEVQFETYLSAFYEGLATFLLEPTRTKQLTDFNDFIKLLVLYFERANEKSFPLTFSGFVASKFSLPTSGGLFIEFADKSYDVDERKFDDFLEDDNFKLYTELAESYGMKVDLWVPWRLIADVESPIMKRRFLSLHTTSTSLDEFFEDYYNVAFKKDIEKLQETLFRFYSTFILNNPEFMVVTKNNRTIRQKRKRITFEEIKQKPNAFWLRLYAFLRAREINLLTSQGTFDNLAQEANELSSIFGTNKAVFRINDAFGALPRNNKDNSQNFRY